MMKPYMDMAGILLHCPVNEVWCKELNSYTKVVEQVFVLNPDLYTVFFLLGIDFLENYW